MKDLVANLRFPESAALFLFCREMLAMRHGTTRILDQDIGGLLHLDPADSSHWKKGKKHIRSVQAIEAIASQLKCDPALVAAVATGEMDEAEAVLEARGHGAFEVNQAFLETFFREMQRQHSSQWSRDRERIIIAASVIDKPAIAKIVATIHGRIGCFEAPVFMPEISKLFPVVAFENIPAARTMRPYYRFEMARQVGRFVLAGASQYQPQGRGSLPSSVLDHVRQVEENMFAMELLAPFQMVRAEMIRADVKLNFVNQLADVFWLSRSIMNRRIKDVLLASS